MQKIEMTIKEYIDELVEAYDVKNLYVVADEINLMDQVRNSYKFLIELDFHNTLTIKVEDN